MVTYQAAMRGVPVDLLPAGSEETGAGVGIAIPSSFRHHKFSIITSSGVVSGAVRPESAEDPSYTGTWNPIASTITVPAASSVLEYQFEGAFSAIRANITTIISGGTVRVTYTGEP